jgi:hypothetical protein
MDIHQNFEERFRLSLAEMNWVMDKLGAKNLVGLKMEDLQEKSEMNLSETGEKEITRSLQKKGILLPDEKKGFTWDPKALAILDAVIFPEQALIVLRDQQEEGRRFFRVLGKAKTIVLHSFPNDREHLIGLFRQPEDILRLVLSWFPFYQLPFSPIKFHLEKTQFDNFKSLVIEGKRDEALKAFNPEGLDSAQKNLFLRSLWNTTISGSIARISLQDGHTQGEDSIAFLTDGRVGWLITQDDPPHAGTIPLTIQRTGVDFSGAVRDLVEAFSGSKLPRRQTDPTNKTIRFALTLDELARALAAINCQDLSRKLYAGIAQDVTGQHYEERMKNAQQSLLDSGLCTLSERALPVLTDDLTNAILPIGASTSMVQVVKSEAGLHENVGVYIIQDSMFTAYFNYGEKLQVLENGKYGDTSSYIQSIFPDFGNDKGEKKVNVQLSFEILEKVMHKAQDKQEAINLLESDGMPASAANMFAEDVVDAFFHATLARADMPERKKAAEGINTKRQLLTLFLLKSPRHSWRIEYQDASSKGKVTVSDREGFRKALTDLIV